MHAMPGLPILHSRDLVNWRLISYVFNRIDLGPEFSMKDGKNMYGKGIWAPSFVYDEKTKTYYIFTNVNGHTTQSFKASSPYGPWKHWEMKSGFHDLSVFFDNDGKKYVCWGAGNNYLAQLNDELTDTIPGTKRLIATSGAEGAHMYKLGIPFFQNKNLYVENNPVYHTQEVNAPVLLWTGLSDKNVTGDHTMSFYNALRRNGKEVVALFYEGEAHSLQKKEAQIDLTLRIRDWFDQFLKKK